MSEIPKKRLSWRLRVMMAERNISTATELQRLLDKAGYNITSSQLTRVIKDRPDRISTDLLDHLLGVLNCDISDLLRSDTVTTEGAINELTSNKKTLPAKPKKLRVRRESENIAPGEDLTGPKVRAFPIPERKK